MIFNASTHRFGGRNRRKKNDNPLSTRGEQQEHFIIHSQRSTKVNNAQKTAFHIPTMNKEEFFHRTEIICRIG
jgi:hypothetical protein